MSKLTLAMMLVIGLLVTTGLSSAQNSANEPVYKGVFIRFFEWSADSKTVAFDDYYALDDRSTPLRYDVLAGTTRANSDVPEAALRLQLERHPTAPLPTFSGDHARIYVSPNRRLAAYAVDQGDPNAYRLAVTDLTTSQAIILDRIHLAFAADPTIFYVKWSANNAAFLVTVSQGTLVFYYYVNVSQGLDQPQILSLYTLASDFHAETGGLIARVYDIDPSGRYLLIEGGGTTQNPEASGLVILDMVDFSTSEIAPIKRAFAAFNGDNATKINYVTTTGLYEYDRQTGQTRLRDATINTFWADSILISPDARYVATVASSDHQAYLYILEIAP